MITHFVGLEQVEAYCKDLAARLEELKQDTPLVWCPVGFSGQQIMDRVLPFIPEELRKKISIQPLTYRKPSAGQPGQISIVPPAGRTEAEIRGALADALATGPAPLILDSSVHSGASMLGAIAYLNELGAKHSLTYSLVIKQGSAFVPHFFGLIVGDHDRALFLLDAIPNNRLAKPKEIFKGVLRQLNDKDVNRTEVIATDVPSISKVTWGDLWYDVRNNQFCVYVAEVDGAIAGFLKYKVEPQDHMKLDIIAVDAGSQGKGVGAALFRWAETTARSNSCLKIKIWGVERQVPKYENSGYKASGDWEDLGGGEKYLPMSKPLLYHFDLKEMQA